ncbi:MAG: DNA mismatch repair endonuclease MutL [Candidatus Latescibacteria bacterium]|nr:DNA mismatch repair endonuclease MutL [Candidatus Latescibacterota bacterium]
MPDRIRILSDEIANRIAAGEAVERPGSVVKELVENAIDAGADRIVAEVTVGGKETIRVSDNGSGMSRDDALLALERHATSKIVDLSDLRTLRTLGFRGEALPSIAAVSRMDIETRDSEALQGTRVRVESGRVRDVSSTGRDRGTTVAVHGLFFNVPARRKFLKGVETEFKHVSDALTGLALAYPSIAFVLSHNGREILNLGRTECQHRLEAIFGVRFGRDAVFLDGERHGVRVWGFAGRPELARKSGAQQAMVVNGRWVRDRGVTYAVHDGFGGLLVKGFHPAFALLMDLDPSRLDVNVHPAKREVRFADEATVYNAVAEVVRAGLREEDLVPEVDSGIASPAIPAGGPVHATAGTSGGVADAPVEQEAYLQYPLGLEDVQMALSLTVRKKAEGHGEQTDSVGDPGLTDEETIDQVPVWQVHDKYVLAHIKNGLIFVDQHLAHQRMIYEQTLDCFESNTGLGQRLLFPVTLDFGLRQIHRVREAMPLLEAMGFGIRDFGGNTVVVDAIPVELKVWEDGRLLQEVVDELAERERQSSVPVGAQKTVSPLEHRLAAAYARHTAIRTGERLSAREMRALIDRLFATREPFVCPQGRPVVVKMSLDELDRQFSR